MVKAYRRASVAPDRQICVVTGSASRWLGNCMIRISGRAIVRGVVGVCLCAAASAAHAQADLERFSRQLEQIQRDTLLEADTDLSLDQRVFFDYGGYAT